MFPDPQNDRERADIGFIQLVKDALFGKDGMIPCCKEGGPSWNTFDGRGADNKICCEFTSEKVDGVFKWSKKILLFPSTEPRFESSLRLRESRSVFIYRNTLPNNPVMSGFAVTLTASYFFSVEGLDIQGVTEQIAEWADYRFGMFGEDELFEQVEGTVSAHPPLIMVFPDIPVREQRRRYREHPNYLVGAVELRPELEEEFGHLRVLSEAGVI